MEAKIAGMDAIHNKANAIGVALMVGAVEKVGLEMDVMALLGGLLITNVCLNHQVCPSYACLFATKLNMLIFY